MIGLVLAAATHWLVLNDVHLNPFDGRARAVYGDDTNPALLRSAIAQMKREVPDAPVIVLGGDFLAHHFSALAHNQHRDPYRAGEAAIASIARGLNDAFPRAQFLVTLGNNDDPCGDYRSETGGAYASALAKIFAPLVDRNGASPDFKRAFANGGYYTSRLPGGMRAVVLDSVLWSFVYRGSCQSPDDGAPKREQQWLARELTAGENVVLMHIPPGYDAESTTIAHRVLAVPFLSAANDAAFRATLEAQRTHVAFALAAHTHRYDFRLPADVPMLIASSLSPIYRNNPAFYELTIDGTTLVDVRPFVYDGFSGNWQREPSFDQLFETSRLDAAHLRALSERLVSDAALRARWIEAYDVWSWRVGDIAAHRWETFRCAQIAFGASYADCAGTRNRSIAAIVAVAILILGIVVGLFLVLMRRRTMSS